MQPNRAVPASFLLALFLLALFSLGLPFAATPALAHHAMDGNIAKTLFQGLVSGLAHPVLGLDHLAFLLAAGVIAAGFVRGVWLPLALLITGAFGAIVHVNGVLVPHAELAIALSIAILGAVILVGRTLPETAVIGFFAAAGFFHGYALFETIIGAEPTPLGAYFVGMITIQYAVALAALFAVRWLSTRFPGKIALALRGVGVAFGVFGISLATGLA
jgi:urease accessory protein